MVDVYLFNFLPSMTYEIMTWFQEHDLPLDDQKITVPIAKTLKVKDFYYRYALGIPDPDFDWRERLVKFELPNQELAVEFKLRFD